MPVSADARKKVIEASGGFCELFHDVPIEGSMIVHKDHAGIGGMPEDAECNDPDVLLWGCKACHDRLDGRSGHNQPLIVAFSRNAGILEMVDEERRKIPRERIFFHMYRYWVEAAKKYPSLVDKIRQRNELNFDISGLLSWFAPKPGFPCVHCVCPELAPARGSERLTPLADFKRLYPHLGMTQSSGDELRMVGEWMRDEGITADAARGVDKDMLDALRSIMDKVRKEAKESGIDDCDAAASQEIARVLAMSPRPADLWDEIDRIRAGKSNLRNWVIGRPGQEPGDTYVPVKSKDKPDIADDEVLIRGTIIIGAGRVEDIEGA